MNKFKTYIQKHNDILDKFDSFQQIDNAINTILQHLKKDYQF